MAVYRFGAENDGVVVGDFLGHTAYGMVPESTGPDVTLLRSAGMVKVGGAPSTSTTDVVCFEFCFAQRVLSN